LDLSKRFRIFVNDKEKRFFFTLRGGQMVSCGSHKPKKLVRFQPIATKKYFENNLQNIRKYEKSFVSLKNKLGNG
jgi:hypothetical protein